MHEQFPIAVRVNRTNNKQRSRTKQPWKPRLPKLRLSDEEKMRLRQERLLKKDFLLSSKARSQRTAKFLNRSPLFNHHRGPKENEYAFRYTAFQSALAAGPRGATLNGAKPAGITALFNFVLGLNRDNLRRPRHKVDRHQATRKIFLRTR